MYDYHYACNKLYSFAGLPTDPTTILKIFGMHLAFQNFRILLPLKYCKRFRGIMYFKSRASANLVDLQVEWGPCVGLYVFGDYRAKMKHKKIKKTDLSLLQQNLSQKKVSNKNLK
ncbi:unnamed protein product [Ilex paraguariensis]|uniref:Uncharacterized protein n=1 Tax=Ilex paraguariensis TaxID=185542 RepID=A0ABC8UBW8_9AQUA